MGATLALLLGVAASVPIFAGSGMVLTRAGGDSPFLLVRVQQLTTNLRASVLPARWMPDGAHGLGYPFYDFYASLPYYAAAFLHWSGTDLILSIQITQLAGFIVASVATYGLARSLAAPTAAALVASALYTFAPYHLANVYVRGDALSEFTAMALYPVILWCIQRLRARASPADLLALSTSFAALILTHNVSALLFAPLALAWLGVRVLTASPSERRGLLWSGLAGLALGLLLSLWFWAPALRERVLVQLQEQTTGYLHYAGHFLDDGLVQLRLSHDYALNAATHPFRMGLVQAAVWALALIALTGSAIRGRSLKPWQTLTALAAFAYTAMMLPLSRPFWDHLPLIAMAQFPWRLLSIQALLVALLGTTLIPGRRASWEWLLAAGLVVSAAWNGLGALSVDRVHIAPEDVTPQRLMLYETFSGNIGTTIRHEYLPRWMVPRPRTSAVQLAESPKPVPLALEGDMVEAIPREITPDTEVWAIRVSQPSLLAFHTTYYPGWEATVDGSPQGIEPLEGLGLLGLRLQPGSHDVELRFTRTPVRRYTLATSLLATVVWAALLVQALLASHRARTFALIGIAAGVVAVSIAWGAARLTRDDAVAAGPIVADFARCPLFHRELDGVSWGDARLLAYTIKPRTIHAGSPIEIRLTWHEPVSLTVRARLVGLSGHLLSPAPVWAEAMAPLDTAVTRLRLTLPDHLAPGFYAVYIDVLDEDVALQPMTITGHPMGTVSLLPLKVESGHVAAPAYEPLGAYGPPETPPVIALTDASISTHEGGMVQVALTWEALAQAPRDYWLSVRLQDAQGQPLTSRDIPPFLGGYPTTLWKPGQVLSDRVLMPVPEDADASETRVEVVLYDRATLAGIGSVIVPVHEP
ncbi:MAG: 6-pyruvoyl-tetrahydropterin synthase-related protein [Anaerolineae bacterium]